MRKAQMSPTQIGMYQEKVRKSSKLGNPPRSFSVDSSGTNDIYGISYRHAEPNLPRSQGQLPRVQRQWIGYKEGGRSCYRVNSFFNFQTTFH